MKRSLFFAVCLLTSSCGGTTIIYVEADASAPPVASLGGASGAGGTTAHGGAGGTTAYGGAGGATADSSVQVDAAPLPIVDWDAGDSGLPSVDEAVFLSACTLPQGASLNGFAQTADDLKTLLLGTFRVCTNEILYGGTSALLHINGLEGLQFSADGHWRALATDLKGKTVPIDAPDAHGTYAILPRTGQGFSDFAMTTSAGTSYTLWVGYDKNGPMLTVGRSELGSLIYFFIRVR
jgi:hypothetical protein